MVIERHVLPTCVEIDDMFDALKADHAVLVKLVVEYVDARDEAIQKRRTYWHREQLALDALITYRQGVR